MPYFSIIIPSYNRAHLLKRAVDSLLNQTFQDFEIIIVDDASKDTTSEVVKSMNDSRIRYFRNETNQERCISRNKGIELSTGKYVCFLDSDDYHLPNHLQTIYEVIIEKSEPKAFFFVNAWNETNEGVRSERSCPDFSTINPYTYFLHYTVNPQRWAVHREIFNHQKFDKEVVICEDMDVSLRIVQAGFPVFQIKARTTVYVAAEDSFTVSDPKKAEKELFYLKKIVNRPELKHHLPRKEVNRLYSMCYYHLAMKSFQLKRTFSTMKFAIQSFFLCPKGYNGNTNKSLFVAFIYSIPFIGKIIQKINSKSIENV